MLKKKYAGFLAIWGLSIPNFEINIYNGRHEGGRGKTQYTIRISFTLRKRDFKYNITKWWAWENLIINEKYCFIDEAGF